MVEIYRGNPRLIAEPTLKRWHDFDAATLARIQIITGWLDANGEAEERIYDVACADDRAIRNRRCERAVGNTVGRCCWSSSAGPRSTA